MTGLNLISLTVALKPLRWLAAVRGVAPDEGCMLHHALGECFGKGTIQPFRLFAGRNGSRHATLYGYSNVTREALLETAADVATPDLALLFDLPALAVKPMPETWRVGRRLAFDLRCIPVRRLLKPLKPWPGERAPSSYRKGAEIDVYLVDSMRQYPEGLPSGLDRLRLRENLYRQWLAERLAPGAHLHTESTRLSGFRRLKIRRGADFRTAPEAIFHGELTITEPQAFAALLASGVGRHAAYGFGMLLLRPPGGEPLC